MTISSIPSNTASAITPFNPLGKHTVGEEEKDSKNSSFKAVEESSQSSRTASRQEGESKDDKVEALKEDAKERGGNKEEKDRREKLESEQRVEEQQKQTRQKDARNSNTPLDQNRGEADQQDSAKTDLQTNRRIFELNRNYSDFVNQSSRLGSIVSEAV